MREEKILIRIFRQVVELIGDEANRNPEFAAKVDAIIAELPSKTKVARKRPALVSANLPDVFDEWKARAQSDFILWLKDQPLTVLHAEIKAHEFDPSGRTSKWKDPEKLAHFIAEQIRGRTSRGSSFLIANTPQVSR